MITPAMGLPRVPSHSERLGKLSEFVPTKYHAWFTQRAASVLALNVSLECCRLHKRTESKKGKIGVKAASPCLGNPVAKDTEVTDIAHRKEDSDRVLVHEESLYARLQKHSSSGSEASSHTFCVDERIVAEESSIETDCPLRLTEVECTSESNGDSMEEERAIPDLTVEVDPKTRVDSVNSSSYKKGHYSTNACDSIQLSSTSHAHAQQRLHTAELVPVEDSTSHSRDHRRTPLPLREKESGNEPCDANCANKRSKTRNKRLCSMDEQDDRKSPNDELSYKYEDDDSPLIDEEKTSRQVDFRKSDVTREASARLDDKYHDVNSARVIVHKYTVSKEVKSEGCESPIVTEMAANRSGSVKFCGLQPEKVVQAKTSTGNLLKCHNSAVSSQEEGTVTESDAYIANVESDPLNPRATTLCGRAMEMDSRVNITAESNVADFSDVHNYTDLAGHRDLEGTRDVALMKRSRRKDHHASDASSRSSRKSQKKSKSKSKHARSMEGIQDNVDGAKSQGKAGKSKNKSTKSQRRERQRSATAEIGEADDDSGIQGDIYEFNDKESNLEAVGLMSIIRRGKYESRHAATLIVESPVQEMQCNDDYNKTEPPVLVPEEPWPPSDSAARREHGTDSSNGVQSAENCDAEESLER